MSAPRSKSGEKKIWQRRFWEHLIKDEKDLQTHMNYIHYNPVKHGYVRRPEEWEYSSYRRHIAQGICSDLRQNAVLENIEKMNLE